MKRFLQWFIALLQILFGLAFIAVIGLYIFDKFDIAKFKNEDYLKYIAYGCAGLYAVLSIIVMAIVLKQRAKSSFYTVNGGDGVSARVPYGKVKKLLKKASASVTGIGLKKFLILPGTAGYALKLRVNVAGRDVKEASDEFKGMALKLCYEVYGLAFANVEIIVAKITNEADAGKAKSEVQAEMAAGNAAIAKEEAVSSEFPPRAEGFSYNASAFSTPVPEAPAADEPVLETPRPEPAYTAPAETATATVYTPEPEVKQEPIIKTATAPKAGTASRAKASGAKTGTAKTSAAKAAPKTGAAKTSAKAPAKTTAKQKVDPNDPPPFKL